MWEYTHYDELYHYGVKGMRWGVRRAEKLRRKAREYDKYSKEFKKEGSRRYGSDGARQTDKEIEWMNKLAANNKKKSKKYEAKAQTIEAKIKTKEELKASIERGKKVCQRIAKENPYDPEKHRTIYDALNKKDAADYRAYQKDFGKKEVAVILTALTGVTVATLLTPNKG